MLGSKNGLFINNISFLRFVLCIIAISDIKIIIQEYCAFVSGEKKNYGSTSWQYCKRREALARWVFGSGHAPNLVDDRLFKKMLRTCDPSMPSLSRS